jgi:hypothetical protein
MTLQIAGRPVVRPAATGDLLRQALVTIATITTLVVNYLANALPINGLGTGEISNRFDVLFVPAGYVFSIWGLIYLGLIGYTVYQALPSQRANPLQRAVGPLYAMSALANISWIFLWHYEQFVLTIPVMLVLLVCLIAIYLRVNASPAMTQAERWLLRVPFSVYLGWITVATIANVTSTLDFLNWSGWGIAPEVWFGIMLAIATVIGADFAWRRRDVAYVAVLVWAFAGIAAKHSGNSFAVSASIVAAAALAILLAVAWWRKR